MDEARRLQYLAAMGIRAWRLRNPAPAAPSAPADADRWAHSAPAPVKHPGPPTAPPTRPAASALPERTHPPAWLDEPPPWTDDELAEAGAAAPAQADAPVAGDTRSGVPATSATQVAAGAQAEPSQASEASPVAGMDWETLEARVAGCRDCILCETRTQTVFGVGNRNAELMFIGEGPGQDEDRQGEPFVGRAGQLLNKMLRAIGLSREQVYIANIVKCRPPRNRNPSAEEAAACRPYLERQIALIQPKLIVSLGAVSANNLLGNTDAVGRLRHRLHSYQRPSGDEPIPLIVTYHPSYYLRSPAEKAKGWQDLQFVMKTLHRQGREP
ncbi:hypothetical protein CKO40_00505 [Halochromatium glycolicum]|uniref:Type-4 uracil-DNA glycosylase n=2 Tax=Halochromatium glycolicum TaxID=85075 RepID=A0AAJ0X7I4_9GAMM|nr:uracil-DNA glycosylase [Halochromatium glycolicum]MBK1703071.1 hypothetical protein [Halochromatium glycolicum]